MIQAHIDLNVWINSKIPITKTNSILDSVASRSLVLILSLFKLLKNTR